MSTTTASNQEFEKVRERVLKIAREIEKLSQSDMAPQMFFPKFLQMLVQALGAQAGAVWQFSEGGQLSLNTEVNLAETGLRDNPQAAQKNHKFLSEVIQTGESVVYAPDDEKADELPTNHLIVLSPLQVDSDSVGAVQIFQRPDAPAIPRGLPAICRTDVWLRFPFYEAAQTRPREFQPAGILATSRTVHTSIATCQRHEGVCHHSRQRRSLTPGFRPIKHCLQTGKEGEDQCY